MAFQYISVKYFQSLPTTNPPHKPRTHVINFFFRMVSATNKNRLPLSQTVCLVGLFEHIHQKANQGFFLFGVGFGDQ